MSALPGKRTVYVVAFWDSIYPQHRDFSVVMSLERGRSAAKNELDPGWHAEVYRVELRDPIFDAQAPPLVYDEDES